MPPHVLLAILALLVSGGGALGKPVAARDCFTSNDPDQILDACGQAIAMGSRMPATYRTLAYVLRGTMLVNRGENDRAIADLNEAIRLDPGFESSYDERGQAYYQKGDLDKAAADLAKALQLNPRLAHAYGTRALLNEKRGDPDKALADYSAGIAINPKYAFAYRGRGNLLLERGEVDRALADYEQAVKADPSALSHKLRGSAHLRKGDLDLAEADFQEAVRQFPKYAAALSGLGSISEKRHDWPRAIDFYGQAVAADPDLGEAYRGRGGVRLHTGELDLAIEDFDQALRVNATDAAALALRGGAALRKGDVDAALKDAEAAIRLDPKLGAAFVTRGDAYRAKGDARLASADYDRAIELDGSLQETVAESRRALATTAANETPGRAEASGKPDAPATPPAAVAGEDHARVALVIGNSAYAAFPKLPNPSHDAEDMAEALRHAGFEVTLATDAGRDAMQDRFADFAKAARHSEVALVFYAGHGFQFNGANYLVPVDARINDATDLRRAVRVQDVVDDLDNAPGAKILILDACRQTDVVQRLSANLPANRGGSVTRGLARSEAQGIFIAYSTQPGSVAADGGAGARNSPFTGALLKYLPTPGIDVRVLFTRVRGDVYRKTNGGQNPEVSDSLVGEFAFE